MIIIVFSWKPTNSDFVPILTIIRRWFSVTEHDLLAKRTIDVLRRSKRTLVFVVGNQSEEWAAIAISRLRTELEDGSGTKSDLQYDFH